MGYHDDVPLSTWNKKFEITNDSLNFITPVKMTKKQLKIQDATNDDNSITKKVFDGKKTKCYYNNLSHNNGTVVGPVKKWS